MAMVVLVLFPALWCRAEDGDVSSRDTLDRWIEAKTLLSRERQDWRLGKQVLEDRIALGQSEIAALREMTEAAQATVGAADEEFAGLENRNDGLKTAMAGLVEDVARLEVRVQGLLARSPAPIRQRVKPLSRRIPVDPTETGIALSERFQNVVGILNELNRFNSEITEANEVRVLPDGSRAEVTVLYLGLGQAYYCNEMSGVAGIGQPGEKGWTWEARDDLVEEITQAIAVFRNEKRAVYVVLPVEVE
jgi:hypothetical protein